MKISQLFKYFKLTPLNYLSGDSLSKERYRLATLTVMANILSRGLAMVIMIITVMLTVPYLGPERFGVWMIFASFVGMLSFMDLGVANALTNKVAHSAAIGNPRELCRTISGGLAILAVIGFSVGLILIGLSFILPWDLLIKLSDANLYIEVKNSALIFSGLFGLNIFSNGLQRVFAGLQRSFEAHIISSIGSIIVLLLLWVAVKNEAGIPILLLITLGVQSSLNIFLILILKKRKLFSFLDVQVGFNKEIKYLIKVGGTFFLLQIGVMISSGSDSLIISSQLGASDVALYAVLVRLFQIATQPMNMVNGALWGSYADAHSRNEKDYIRKTLKFSMKISFVFTSIVVIFLVIFGELLVSLWTERAIQLPVGLVLVYGIWIILDTVGNSFGVFLNGCGVLRPQIFIALFFITFGTLAKFSFINLFGIEGLLLGSILTFILIQSVIYGWLFRNELIEVLGGDLPDRNKRIN